MPENDKDLAAHWIDLAQPRLGSEVVFATDEFFAAKERLIDPAEPVYAPDKYDAHGKWMDGWESRRRRDGGHDHCILRLGRPGAVAWIDIDTRHFTGNFPAAASLDACVSAKRVPGTRTRWTCLVPARPLQGNSRHTFSVAHEGVWTHLRLNIYPDGGVARLRVYGQVQTDWAKADSDAVIDLAAMDLGGRPVACNDEHFGRLSNLIAPGRAPHMGDGWETRRRRTPGSDWGIIALAHAGVIGRIVVDTAHFKGNYPDRCSLHGARVANAAAESLPAQSLHWPVLLPEQKLAADREHVFEVEIRPHTPVDHVRFNIIPDGGVSRLRLFGRIVQ